jgi:hypothetical protein
MPCVTAIFLGFRASARPRRLRPEGHKFGLRFENVLYNLSSFEAGCGRVILVLRKVSGSRSDK